MDRTDEREQADTPPGDAAAPPLPAVNASTEPASTEPAPPAYTEPGAGSSAVDPAAIRYRAGVRREGPFRVRYVTVHGYRRAYVKAGTGPVLLLIHGIGD